MYIHLERENAVSSEQKRCHEESCGTKNQLFIDKKMLRDCKMKHIYLAITWIDYKKTYNVVPPIWISECLEMFGIASNVQDFLNNSMKSWNLELNASGEKIVEVDIRSGIFQGNSLSPLLFVLLMIPLTLLLKKAKAGWREKVIRTDGIRLPDGQTWKTLMNWLYIPRDIGN